MQRATITLFGDRYDTIALPTVGNKMIVAINANQADSHGGGASHTAMAMGGKASVRFGRIDIHGAPHMRSWTKVRGGCVGVLWGDVLGCCGRCVGVLLVDEVWCRRGWDAAAHGLSGGWSAARGITVL